jgi:hypothetical protein
VKSLQNSWRSVLLVPLLLRNLPKLALEIIYIFLFKRVSKALGDSDLMIMCISLRRIRPLQW